MYKQVGDAMLAVLKVEQLSQTRLAYIQTDKYNLLAQQCKAHGKVGCDKCLTLARCCRSGHNNLLTVLQHKLDVCAYRAEYLLHNVVGVLVYHDTSLRLNLFACNSHIANDRQIGKFLYIVVSLNLITEEVDEEQHAYRQGKSKNKRHKQDDRSLWACLAHNQWIVYKLALVCCSCQRYRVLLALLQQHKVQTRLNLLLTSNLCKHALLLRTR